MRSPAVRENVSQEELPKRSLWPSFFLLHFGNSRGPTSEAEEVGTKNLAKKRLENARRFQPDRNGSMHRLFLTFL